MYGFECNARFGEQRLGRENQRLLMISPMIDAKARKVAEAAG
jgi:hypothetical protein